MVICAKLCSLGKDKNVERIKRLLHVVASWCHACFFQELNGLLCGQSCSWSLKPEVTLKLFGPAGEREKYFEIVDAAANFLSAVPDLRQHSSDTDCSPFDTCRVVTAPAQIELQNELQMQMCRLFTSCYQRQQGGMAPGMPMQEYLHAPAFTARAQ